MFQDRLIDNTDREWFGTLLQDSMKTFLNVHWQDVVTSEPLLYGDFLVPGMSKMK